MLFVSSDLGFELGRKRSFSLFLSFFHSLFSNEMQENDNSLRSSHPHVEKSRVSSDCSTKPSRCIKLALVWVFLVFQGAEKFGSLLNSNFILFCWQFRRGMVFLGAFWCLLSNECAVCSNVCSIWLVSFSFFIIILSYYGFGKGDIGQLFIAGFGSSMLFGTIVGSLADKQ